MPQGKKNQTDIPIDPFANQAVDPFANIEEEAVDPFSITQRILGNSYVQSTLSTISPVLNFLSSPSFGSARFADSLMDESKGILDAISDGIAETFAEFPIDFLSSGIKQTKISYSDVIRRRFPQFAEDNPRATQILGFVGDVALDPSSYIGVGTLKNGVKVGSRILSKEAVEGLTEGIKAASRKAFVGKNGTIELIQDFNRLEDSKVINKIKDTKIVDAEGFPKRYFHGTSAPDFKKFNTAQDVRGAYFSESPDVAAQYGSRTIPVFLNIKKPLDYDDFAPQELIDLATKYKVPYNPGDKAVDLARDLINTFDSVDPLRGQQKLFTQLKKKGFDGIEFLSNDKGIVNKQAIAFDPDQIQFALTRRGGVIRDFKRTSQELEGMGYFENLRLK